MKTQSFISIICFVLFFSLSISCSLAQNNPRRTNSAASTTATSFAQPSQKKLRINKKVENMKQGVNRFKVRGTNIRVTKKGKRIVAVKYLNSKRRWISMKPAKKSPTVWLCWEDEQAQQSICIQCNCN
ncbi:MAG: hypothetical protein AAFY71_16915 [Bacteroidota bacterium]